MILVYLLDLISTIKLILHSYTATVKPLLETTCIKRLPALRDHCSDTTTLLKSIQLNLHLKTTFITSLEGSLNAGYTVLWIVFMFPSNMVLVTDLQCTFIRWNSERGYKQSHVFTLMISVP